MSIELRIILLVASIISVVYIVMKLKKTNLQLLDALYWLIVSFILALLGIVPQLASWISKRIGIQSPVNLVFLVMLFIVLLRCFLLSMRMSKLEGRLKEYIEETAVRRKIEEE